MEVQVATLSEACRRLLKLDNDQDGSASISGTRRRSPDNDAMHTRFKTSNLHLIPPAPPATEHAQREP
ncbi:hypothetical protein K443DRAFT_221669 [Laccaria amethystina LaAM-08-1]|uniref:Uncharacterized protein n=1 Tax=Laccaria amethystina LaAM-08-1 TaxID=1095629 RepID=A0A0C9XQ30_9AGAR|nr:hypothetical protein K443DRAFT_221669 [Laccaria amethystina LaAM-08-1]